MAIEQSVETVDPRGLERNPENPRLIFRLEELENLQESIRVQGILVPLTVYRDGSRLIILDGERRWRCAIKLGMPRVPVIVQPKPDRLQNIMMMFAIHNSRTDWDPLPTAYKLSELEQEFSSLHGRLPREIELAELASLTRGEVRRLKVLLGLPAHYRDELMAELEKPRSEQVLTVDHVLETTRGVAALRNRRIISADEEEPLRRAVIAKFRTKVIGNTVEPRKLARIARSVEREEISKATARSVTARLATDPDYSIEQAFYESAESADFEHSVVQLVARVDAKLGEIDARSEEIGERLVQRLIAVRDRINRLLARQA